MMSSKTTKELCEHLQPVLAYELTRGNTVRNIDVNAWTNAVLVVNLEKAIDVNKANSLVEGFSFISYYDIDDYHYELQKGYFCERCKHSLAGPK